MSGSFDAAFLLKKILTGRGACCILLCILNALPEGKMEGRNRMNNFKLRNVFTVAALSVATFAGGLIVFYSCAETQSIDSYSLMENAEREDVPIESSWINQKFSCAHWEKTDHGYVTYRNQFLIHFKDASLGERKEWPNY
jgi:hypothetical protein